MDDNGDPLSELVTADRATFILPGDRINARQSPGGGLWLDVSRNGTAYARIVVHSDGDVIGAVHYYSVGDPEPNPSLQSGTVALPDA